MNGASLDLLFTFSVLRDIVVDTSVVSVAMKALKNEELEKKLEELREEKARLSDAFVNGRIPKDVYRKQ